MRMKSLDAFRGGGGGGGGGGGICGGGDDDVSLDCSWQA